MDAAQRTLYTAADLVAGDRAQSHGHYPTEARRIGQMWGAILDLPEPVPPRTVAAMMVALKLARATAGRQNPDDWVDACGYSALASQIDYETTQVWA
jgi:hypothetical protein